jgi:dTDP-4-dehydrorhamnose 3,5-epimerase
MEALGIEGAWVFTPQVYQDDRGAFFEAFRGGEFAADLGYRLDVAQVNCSVSRRGVIRGIHYADVPPGQVRHLRPRRCPRCGGGPACRVSWLREVGGGASG